MHVSCHLFWTLAKPLATCDEALPQLPVRWSGTKRTRRDYAAICDIPLDIQREELDHRIEVFGADPNFGSRSNICLRGVEFATVRPVAPHTWPAARIRGSGY